MEWYTILISQVRVVPFLIIYCVGSILAAVRWNRHPTVSLLALCAFGILLANLAMSVVLQVWQFGAHDRGVDAEEIGRVFGAVAMIRSFLSVIAWSLLLTALFGWRHTDQALYDE